MRSVPAVLHPTSLRRVAAVTRACLALLAVPARTRAQAPGEVAGVVTNARSGAGIADARLELLDGDVRTRSTIDGHFTLRGVSPGAQHLRATGLGFRAVEVTLVATNGRTTTVAIAMQELPQRLRAIAVRADRGDLPLGTISISRAQIDSAGKRDLAELLGDQAGLTITRTGGAGAPARLSVRGSSAAEVLLLVNGVPADALVTGEADLSLVSLENVERVTVLRGAQSARYGPRALAGVVLVETRRAEQARTSLDVATGSWGERTASASVVNRFDDLSVSLTGDLSRAAGGFRYDVPAVRGGGEANRLNDGTGQRGLFADVGYVREIAELRVRGGVRAVDRDMPGSIVQPTTLASQSEHRANAGIATHLEGEHVQLSLDGDIERQGSAFDDPDPSLGPPYHERLDVHALSGRAAVTTHLDDASLSVGADARSLRFTSTMLVAGSPTEQQVSGVWAQARLPYAVGEDVLIEVTAAVRSDASSLLAGRTVSPRIALSATRGAVALTVSAGEAFNPPSLADQFFHEGVLVRANPALQPERVHRDLEARASLRDVDSEALRLGGDLAVYSADITGMIVWTPDFRFIWSPGNFDVRRSGWEGSAQASLAHVGLALRGALSRSNVVYAGPVLEGQVAFRAATTASLGAVQRVPFGRLELAGRYVGERRTVAGSALNALDPYWLADARLVAPLMLRGWHADLALGAEDLFDARAAMLPDYPYPGRTLRLALQLRRGTPLP